MDELGEILWTPADDSYWERVNAMVTRFGLFKTLGVTLADVRPGRVQIIMPFRAEVSGEGGAFHASLIPTLIAMTSQLAGMTLLPRHFTLKPIDFKCNILSDCDSSTFLLVSRGAVVVRGDHSVTVKIEIMKTSGILSGSTDVITSPTASNNSSIFTWKGWASSPQLTQSNSENINVDPLVPGTGIERSKFVVCASGMQTNVIARASTDQNNEEENEIQRLKREREQSLVRSSTSSSSSMVDLGGDSIILGDNIVPSVRSMSPRPLSPSPREHTQSIAQSIHSSSFEVVSPSSSKVVVPKAALETAILSPAATTVTTTATPFSYATVVKSHVETSQKFQHIYEETSDTEAWSQ
ncbi:hypothetical protein BGZ76_011620 [Entomortierella beljakovae]|nr:hypothetical protein BGZ76_011620 [Entomortierella beljakovae]